MPFKSGEKHHNWVGGRFLHTDGYIMLTIPEDDPYEGHRYYGCQVLEHRYLMSKKLGRVLDKNEHVHHINGNRTDNRLDNLQVMTHAEHISHHKKGVRLVGQTICKNCKIGFYSNHGKRQKFCCQKCASAWTWSKPGKTRKINSGWKFKKPVPPRNCEFCNKEFYVRVNSKKTTFCSRSCVNLFRWRKHKKS